MLSKVNDRAEASGRVAKLEGSVQTTPTNQPSKANGVTVEHPDVCPNCGSIDRLTEPFVDENGTLTDQLSVLCAGCGYRFGDLPTLPPATEAEDAEKSLEILPPRDPED